MSAAFTPGPWRVCEGRTQGRLTIESDDATIAYAAVGDGEDEDANLIAAVPDLYEALLYARCALHGPLLERADAALAKARGESL